MARRSTIDLAPMADMKNRYGAPLVVDLVHYPLVTDANAPSLPGGQLQASLWPRILS